jgi:hypothetical protein
MTFVQPSDSRSDTAVTDAPSSGAIDHVRITRGAALYGPERTVQQVKTVKKPTWWQRISRWFSNLL